MTMESPGASASEHDILKVGICQIYTEQWQIKENFKRTVEALEEAAQQALGNIEFDEDPIGFRFEG